jgi:hypothetical protein
MNPILGTTFLLIRTMEKRHFSTIRYYVTLNHYNTYLIHMYVSEKMIPVETVPWIRGGGEGEQWRG